MSGVLYYSNSCPHSAKLLQHLKKTNFGTKFQYICVDNREKDATGKTQIILNNGKRVIMPPTLTSIPGLMLLDRNYQILYGDEIYKYLEPRQVLEVKEATQNNMVPQELEAFSFGGGSGSVVSDNYSFLDQELQLAPEFNGGMKQMHHYADLNATDNHNNGGGNNGNHGGGQLNQSDNIRQSNNRIRDGEVNPSQLAEQRGYNTSQGQGGRGFN